MHYRNENTETVSRILRVAWWISIKNNQRFINPARPKTPVTEAFVKDINNQWYNGQFEKNEEKKKEMQENFNKVFLPERLRMIEKRMTSSGGQFLAANALSWADIHFLQVYYTLPTGIFILYTYYRYIHIMHLLQVYSY